MNIDLQGLTATKIQALARGHLARKNIKKRLSLQKLPKEILNKSAKFLEFKEQAYLAYTCKDFYGAQDYFNIDVIKNKKIEAEKNKFKRSFNNDDLFIILKSLNNKIKNGSITLPKHTLLLRKMFKSFLSDLNVNATDNNGQTALHYAAMFGYTEFVGALIDSGANVNVTNNYGSTPLHYAARRGHTEIVQVLIDSDVNMEVTNNDGNTPLYLAAHENHTKVVQALIDSGANVNVTDKNGSTPLHFAAYKGHTEFVGALIDSGANVNATDKNGQTALHLAAHENHTKVVQALIDSGANVNATDKNGSTLLHFAARRGHTEIVQALIDSGAIVNAPMRATKIQALARGHLARKNIKQLNNAALVVQKKVKQNLSKTDFYKPYKIIVKSLREKGKLLNCLYPHLIRQTTSFLDITNQLRFKNTCRSFYRMKMFKTSSFPPYYASKLNFHRVKNKIIGALYFNPEIDNLTSRVAFRDPNRCRVEGFSHREILAILSQDKFGSINEGIPRNARYALSYLNTLESLSPAERTIYDTLNFNPEEIMISNVAFRDPNRCRVEGFSHREILTILSQDKFGSINEGIPRDARYALSYLNALESLSPEERTIYDTLNSNPEMDNLTSRVAFRDPNRCRVEGFSHREILTILSQDKFGSINEGIPRYARYALSYLNALESLSPEERTIYDTLNSNPETDNHISTATLKDPIRCRVEGFSHREILIILSQDKFGSINEGIPSTARYALSYLNALESLSPEERTIYDTLNSNPEMDNLTSRVAFRDPNRCRVEGFSHREILTILSQDTFSSINEWIPRNARYALSYLNALESLSPEERTIYDTLNSNPETDNHISTATLKDPIRCRVEGFSHREILIILSQDKFGSINEGIPSTARYALSYLNALESLSPEERTIYDTLNSNPEEIMISNVALRDPNLCRVEGFSHREILTILSQEKFGSLGSMIPFNARQALSALN